MARVKLVCISCFLLFFYRVFNQFENISTQNKDTEVVSVQKTSLIKLSLSTLSLKSSESSEFKFGF